MPYVIDGHNLIGKTPGVDLDDPDDEQKLIALLGDYLTRIRKKGVVVFDRGLPGGASRWSTHWLEVRFAPHPKTADEVIVERLSRTKNRREITVVTSDAELARTARAMGAKVMAAEDFAQAMTTQAGEAARPSAKETGLSPEEVEAWEEEFRKRGKT